MPTGGCLNLSDRGISDLSDLPVFPDLVVLVLRNNKLTSFGTLKVQPKLTTIRAANNPIDSLNGLSQQPSLQNLDISGAPVCAAPDFRPRAIASIGGNLRVLNGKKLNRMEQEQAEVFAGQNRLFIQPEGDDGGDQQDGGEDLSALHELYVKEHREFFPQFALNEATVFELQKFGPLPYIDETSSDIELAQAIRNVKRRVEGSATRSRSWAGNLTKRCLM
jgi:hypothetical protein